MRNILKIITLAVVKRCAMIVLGDFLVLIVFLVF
nr:MAG TPA: hypothetical protein [Caudoviricetes sp.]